MSTSGSVLTLADAAERLGISHKTLRRWAAAGHIKLVTLWPTHRLRITVAEVERIESQRATPVEAA